MMDWLRFGLVAALIAAALLVARGIAAADWKLLLLILLLWIGSPISSHLVARLEVMTDEELAHHLTVEKPGKKEDTGNDNP